MSTPLLNLSLSIKSNPEAEWAVVPGTDYARAPRCFPVGVMTAWSAPIKFNSSDVQLLCQGGHGDMPPQQFNLAMLRDATVRHLIKYERPRGWSHSKWRAQVKQRIASIEASLLRWIPNLPR